MTEPRQCRIARWSWPDCRLRLTVAWEAGQQRPWLLYALGGLGALTVALGFLAIIASNWEAIGSVAKLGADLLVGAGLAFGLVRAESRGARWVREILIILLYGWTVASIGLVSQIYNMGGETWQALLYWNALTALLMTRGKSGFVASIFYCGLLWMCGVMMAKLGNRPHDAWIAAPAVIPPTLLLFASSSRWLARVRPAFARTAGAFGWTFLLLGLSIVPQFFHVHLTGEDVERFFPSIALGAACTFVLLVVGPRLLAPFVEGEVPPRAGLLLRVLLGLHLSVGVGALVLPHERLGIVAALSFIALWVLVAALAQSIGQRRLLNTATAVIGVRVLIVYFEVFGSLLSTGLGMILGGLLTLGLVWLWIRKSLRRPSTEAGSTGTGGTDNTGADADMNDTDLGGSL
mgnify:FL=1